jgi:hypothetical protein
MGAFIDYTGKKIGKLTVKERARPSESGRTRWICDCECGQDGVVLSATKIVGGQHHCGCEFNAKGKNISAAHKRRQEKAWKPADFSAADIVINEFLYHYKGARNAPMRTDEFYGPLPEARYCQIPPSAPPDRLEIYLRGLR